VGADPPHRASLESAAGGATETVPTSECRRRPKGTGSRISITAKTSGSARREAREAFTFEARAENDAAGLGGRIFDPDTLPSYRAPRARGPGTSRVPEPAPLRVRSRRGLRVRSELVRFFVVRRCFESSHTVVARSRHPSARQTRCEQLLQARSRGSSVRLVASRGRRDRRCVRSTSALRNRPNSSTRASPFPGAAAIWRCLSAIVRRRALVPEPRGSVLVHANVSFARRPARPKTGGAGTGKLGAARCERGRGESRFTARLPLWRPDDSHAAAFSSAVRNRKTERQGHPCRLLRAVRARRVFPFRARARRPPRPVPRGPRERRAHLRSRVPSIDRCRAHPARAGARTKLRCRHLGRGAHVMRIAEPRCHAPLLPATCPCACAPERPRWSGSRSRAPCTEWAFDPVATGDALL